MKLIIGLGNPGKEYTNTRHNAGSLCLDFLQKEFEFEPFSLDKRMSATIASGTLESQKILFVKPDVFMNNSGTIVQNLLQFYKLSPSDMVVIHDDLDIAPETYKTTTSSRAAGHNGVQDIIDMLGTQDFFRIRLGIGRPTCIATRNTTGEHNEADNTCMPARHTPRSGVGGPSHDFVLKNFSAEELTKLTTLFPKAKEEILLWLKA